MTINITDKTGEPRSLDDLKEARAAVRKALFQFDLSNPLLIHLTVISDALAELIAIREFIASKKQAAPLPSISDPSKEP